MKKIVALFLTLALLISAAALPALAEGETETTVQTTSETRQTGRGGPGGQQPPAMPGNGQNGQGGPDGQQPPAMPGGGQNDHSGPGGQQPPAKPDGEQSSQDAQSGQQPGNEETDQSSQDGRQPKGKPGKKGRGGRSTPDGEPEKRLDFEQLVIAAKEAHTLLEINNHSLAPERKKQVAWDNNRELLRLCKQHHVPLILGSDAHISFQIADYSRILPLLEEINFPDELVMNYWPEQFFSYLSLPMNK